MSSKTESINVVFLRAVGFQRYAATPVEIKFNPEGITFIEGKNGSGKSTALDALLFAWAGKTALAKVPIHEGMDEASVEIGLSDGKRVRRFVRRKGEKQYTTGLELFGPKGEQYESREATVKEWLGDPGISFDPMEFSRMEPKKRRILLAQLVGIDLDKFDADENAAEQIRLAHYGIYETAKRKKESLPPVLAAKPATVDVAGLNLQLSAALAAQSAAELASSALRLEQAAVAQQERELQLLFANLEATELKLAEMKKEHKSASLAYNKRCEAMHSATQAETPPLPDISAIQAQIANAAEANKASVEYDMLVAQRNEINATWKTEDAKRETLTAAVEAVREARLKALQTATFPVEGLGFEVEDCTYNSIPFSQASQSEKIKVGMAIAMAQHPTLKVISSYDGSLLDGNNIAVIDEMAKGQGYTVVLEVVSDAPSGKPHSIYLENGMVAGAEEAAE